MQAMIDELAKQAAESLGQVSGKETLASFWHVLKCETRCLEELYHSCDLIARVAIHKKYRKRGMSI